MVNENEYRGLTKEEKERIKPFDLNIVTKTVNNDSLYLYEINSSNIKRCTKVFPFTFIHLWRPFCAAQSCQNINYYENLQDEFKSKGLQLLLISETYGFSDIRNILKHSSFTKPIFVLQDSHFGHKIRKGHLIVSKELAQKEIAAMRGGFDDYLFCDTVLIYRGINLNTNKIDSLLQNTNLN